MQLSSNFPGTLYIVERMCAKSLGTTFVYVVSATFLANAQTNIWNECQVKKRVRTWLAYHNMCIRLLYDKSFASKSCCF